MPRPTRRDVHVNRPLSNISVAYSNKFYIADQVFPVVPVNNQSDSYFVWDKNAWFRLRAGTRAPGEAAPEVDYGISTASYICLNYSLAKGVADETRNNADAPLRPDVNATNFVTDGLMLGMEDRVATIIGASGSWASASNPGTKWDAVTSDAWGDISNLIYAVEGQIGRPANVMVVGRNAWKSLRNHPDLVDRVKYQREGGKLIAADLQGWFDVDKVLIGRARKDTSEEGATAAMTDIWGDFLWVGYVTPAPAIDEPTAGYCFRWGARSVSRYREDVRHRDLIEAEEWMDECITASDAGGGFYDVSASA
jgi:hypothetical protein